MSVICDAIIIAHLGDDKAIAEVNLRLHERDDQRHQQFAKLDEGAAGGSKFLCAEIWAGAFNYLTPDEIEDAVAQANWSDPEDVVLVLHAYDYDEPASARTVVELRAVLERTKQEPT